MKIVAKFDDGSEIELKEMQGLNKDCDMLIVKLSRVLRSADIQCLQRYLQEQTGYKVIILPWEVDKVMTL